MCSINEQSSLPAACLSEGSFPPPTLPTPTLPTLTPFIPLHPFPPTSSLNFPTPPLHYPLSTLLLLSTPITSLPNTVCCQELLTTLTA